MAKKVEQIKVRCQECKFGGNENNHLVDCFNESANPGGYKKGAWEKPCQYYVRKKEVSTK